MRTFASIVVPSVGHSSWVCNTNPKKPEQCPSNDLLSVLVLALATAFAAGTPILVLKLSHPWAQDRINRKIDWISGVTTCLCGLLSFCCFAILDTLGLAASPREKPINWDSWVQWTFEPVGQNNEMTGHFKLSPVNSKANFERTIKNTDWQQTTSR